jgi:hypothetical protein
MCLPPVTTPPAGFGRRPPLLCSVQSGEEEGVRRENREEGKGLDVKPLTQVNSVALCLMFCGLVWRKFGDLFAKSPGQAAAGPACPCCRAARPPDGLCPLARLGRAGPLWAGGKRVMGWGEKMCFFLFLKMLNSSNFCYFVVNYLELLKSSKFLYSLPVMCTI